MPKVQQQGNNMPSSHYFVLTDSECNKYGAHLEWKVEFNDISSPRYIAQHCGLDYLITIDTVKVEMVKVPYRTKNKENKLERKANEHKPQYEQ